MNTKPTKTLVPLEVGLFWGNDGFIYQTKEDGCFDTLQWRGMILAGERMKDGRFIAWDVLFIHGEDVRLKPASERMAALLSVADSLRTDSMELVRMSPHGGNLLRQVLAENGEGVVRKNPNATYFEPFEAAKRVQDFTCRITNCAGGKQSVEIADAATGQTRGRVSLFGGRADKVRVGSLVKVNGLGLTKTGMIRDPRPDKDTAESWLIKY